MRSKLVHCVKKRFLYPNGRKDVFELQTWFALMMKRMEEMKVKNLKEYFDYLQFVYGACLKEMIK